MGTSEYALLRGFRGLFEGKPYLHRDSSLGDRIASCLYEDLYTLGRSTNLHERIDAGNRVLNARNVTVGIVRRRGDGTFGELVPAGAPFDSSLLLRNLGFAQGRLCGAWSLV
jgi:hypothetical protein